MKVFRRDQSLLKAIFLSVTIIASTMVWADNYVVKDQIIVKIHHNQSISEEDFVSEKNSIMEEFGATLVRKLDSIDAEVWEVEDSATTTNQYFGEDAEGRERFDYVEPNYKYELFATKPNDPKYEQQWNLEKVSAVKAWDFTTGTDIIVAVIDKGMDYNNVDLYDNIWRNPNPNATGCINDNYGCDFVNQDGDPSEDGNSSDQLYGHATHIAGTIAAKGNNNIGIAGINWSARIMPIKVFNTEGVATSDTIILGIAYAVKNGAKISNNSWGGRKRSQALYDAIEKAGEQGHLFIAAAGNLATNNDENPVYPASYTLENIIAVAATDSSNNLFDSSSYGKISVDIAAPGENIYGIMPNGKFDSLSGTSPATAHISGAAALFWSFFPEASHMETKERILSAVDTKDGLKEKLSTGGRLNLLKGFPENNKPVANFVNPPKFETRLLELDGTGSYDNDDREGEESSIMSYVWYITNHADNDKSLKNRLTGEQPTFTFPDEAEGKYNLKLIVTDDKGDSGEMFIEAAIIVGSSTPEEPIIPNETPIASFTMSPPGDETAPVHVYLDGTKSSDKEDGRITNCKWESTAGHYVEGCTASMLFGEPSIESYKITLTIIDNGINDGKGNRINKKSSSLTRPFKVSKNSLPIPSIIGPDQIGVGEEVIFESDSTDDSYIYGYRWEYQGEVISVKSYLKIKFLNLEAQETNHIFLTVKDDKGKEATTRKGVGVTDNPPKCDFKIEPTSVIAMSSVTFTSLSTDNGYIPKFEWSSDKEPELNISSINEIEEIIPTIDGKHKITLKITDNTGNYNSCENSLLVDGVTPVALFKVEQSENYLTLISESYDPNADIGGKIINYEWEIIPNDSQDENDVIRESSFDTITIEGVGIYQVTLRVKDNSGLESIYTQSVEIEPEDRLGVYYIPGSIGNDTTKSFIRLTNETDEKISVRGVLHTEDNQHSENIKLIELMPQATIALSLEELEKQVGIGSWSGLAWLEIIEPNKGLAIMNMFRNKNGTLTNMTYATDNALFNLPPNNKDSKDELNVLLINTTESSMRVKGTLYDERSGKILGFSSNVILCDISSKGICILPADLLQERIGLEEPWEKRAWLQVTEPTKGLKIIGLVQNTGVQTNTNLTCVADNTLFNLPAYSPPTSNEDKGFVRITNTTDQQIDTVKGTLYGQNGDVLGIEESILFYNLPAHATWVLNMQNLEDKIQTETWKGKGRARLVITEPTSGIKLMGLIRSTTGTLTNASCTSDNLYNLPSTPSTDPGNKDKIFIRINNTTNSAVTVRGTVYNMDGETVGIPDITLVDNLFANSAYILKMEKLQELLGESWKGRARLVITYPETGIQLMGMIRAKSGTLTNASSVFK